VPGQRPWVMWLCQDRLGCGMECGRPGSCSLCRCWLGAPFFLLFRVCSWRLAVGSGPLRLSLLWPDIFDRWMTPRPWPLQWRLQEDIEAERQPGQRTGAGPAQQLPARPCPPHQTRHHLPSSPGHCPTYPTALRLTAWAAWATLSCSGGCPWQQPRGGRRGWREPRRMLLGHDRAGGKERRSCGGDARLFFTGGDIRDHWVTYPWDAVDVWWVVCW